MHESGFEPVFEQLLHFFIWMLDLNMIKVICRLLIVIWYNNFQSLDDFLLADSFDLFFYFFRLSKTGATLQ
jgi:hypothetical protein